MIVIVALGGACLLLSCLRFEVLPMLVTRVVTLACNRWRDISIAGFIARYSCSSVGCKARDNRTRCVAGCPVPTPGDSCR
jgi:hypothetical protein